MEQIFIEKLIKDLHNLTFRYVISWKKIGNARNSFSTSFSDGKKSVEFMIGSIDNPETKFRTIYISIIHPKINQINITCDHVELDINKLISGLYELIYTRHISSLISDTDKKFIIYIMESYDASNDRNLETNHL